MKRCVVRKAQYSIEFLLVFSFSLLVVIPLVILMQSEYNASKGELDIEQARQVLDDMAIGAQKTYYAGYPSRTTLDLYFPERISSVEARNVLINGRKKSELVLRIDEENLNDTLVHVLPFWINVSVSSSSGLQRVLIKARSDNIVNISEYAGS